MKSLLRLIGTIGTIRDYLGHYEGLYWGLIVPISLGRLALGRLLMTLWK